MKPLYEKMIESQFKKAPEGWLFTTPNPWFFPPRRTYLVSDAQKPALAAGARRGAYFQLILHVLMTVLLLVVIGPSLLNFLSVATWLIVGGFVVVWTILTVVGGHLAVRPLLRDVPRSSQQIALTMLQRRWRLVELAVGTLMLIAGIGIMLTLLYHQ